MIKKILSNLPSLSLISKFFIIYWVSVMTLDFIINSSDIISGFSRSQYYDFLISYFVLGALVVYLLADKPVDMKVWTFSKFRWIYIYIFLVFTMTLLMGFILAKSGSEASIIGFVGKLLKTHLFIFLIVFSAFGGGKYIFSKTSIQFNSSGLSNLISLAVGFISLTIGLFILGALKLLSPIYITILFVLFLTLGGKHIFDFLKNGLISLNEPFTLKPGTLFLLLAGILLIAINLIGIITPVPIGYDSLTLYMNIPKLMDDYNSLVQGYQPHYWSIIVSTGYTLFNDNVVAQYIGILPGILSIFAIYFLARLFVKRDWAIFSSIIFYSIPIILWQSSFEIKTDLGMLFFVLMALILLFQLYSSANNNTIDLRSQSPLTKQSIIYWSLIGALLGFALGIKLTALMAIYSFIILIFYRYGGKFLAISSFFLCFATIFSLKLYTFSNFEFSSSQSSILIIFFLVLGVSFLLYSYIKAKENFILPFKISIVLAIAVGVMFMPWAIKNTLEHGSISFSNIITGKSSTPQLLGELTPDHSGTFRPILMKQMMSSEADVSQPHLVAENNITGKKEEINRYLGYEGGFLRFFSLPYDLSMKKNVDLFSTDLGLLFIVFLPFLFLIGTKPSSPVFILRISFLLLWLSFSLTSVYNPETSLTASEVLNLISNSDPSKGSGGFSFLSKLHLVLIAPLIYLGSILSPIYSLLGFDSDLLSIIIIIFFMVILFFLSKKLIKNEEPSGKALFLFSGVYFFFWLTLSSGIPWYGIVGLSLMPLFIAKFIFSSNKDLVSKEPIIKYLSAGVISLWFVLILPYKLSPLASVKVSDPSILNFNEIINEKTLLFACNELSEEESKYANLNPQTEKMIRILNMDSDAIIMNIGSLMKYYLSKNDLRLIDDNQLDFFKTIWDASGEHQLVTSNKLKALNVKYILLDLGVHTMDKTKDKSLLKKVEEFVEYIYKNPNVELLATDRIVIHPKGEFQMEVNGEMVQVKYDIFGNGIVENGKLALFQIN